MWYVQFQWNSGVQFTFNFHHYWFTLVIWDADVYGRFLHRKEGVTQGDTLSRISYGIVLVPIIRKLWKAHRELTQPWYAGKSGTGSKLSNIKSHL